MTDERFELPAQLSIALSDASKVKIPDHHSATAEPMLVPDDSSVVRAEDSDLERRFLALERVQQARVAHMAEAEPKFPAGLTETHCVPLRMTRFEHNYRDTESHAAEFVRSVVRLGERAARKSAETARDRRLDGSTSSSSLGETPPLLTAPCIRVRQPGGVWQVTKNG